MKTKAKAKKTKSCGITRAKIEQWLLERDLSLILADGLDEAFLGVDFNGDEPRAVYSREKCIEILARDMTHDDAVEYFEFNTAGAYVGPQTPLFIDTPDFDAK